MKKVVIWGSSGHSKVISEIININNEYKIIGYLDNVNIESKGKKFLDNFILGSDDKLDELKNNGIKYLFLAFGDCNARLEISKKILLRGFELINVIHPRSIISKDLIMGFGNAIMAGVIINPGSIIGNNVILNSGSCIEHDCQIEDGCHICPGVTLGGNVKINKGTWIGIGSTIKDHITIGSNCFIGAGTNIVKNIPDNSLVYGNPGKIIKKL